MQKAQRQPFQANNTYNTVCALTILADLWVRKDGRFYVHSVEGRYRQKVDVCLTVSVSVLESLHSHSTYILNWDSKHTVLCYISYFPSGSTGSFKMSHYAVGLSLESSVKLLVQCIELASGRIAGVCWICIRSCVIALAAFLYTRLEAATVSVFKLR